MKSAILSNTIKLVHTPSANRPVTGPVWLRGFQEV